MHLKKEQIVVIAEHVTRDLKATSAVTFKVSEDQIRDRVQEVIMKNMQEELAIEEQVKKLMDQYKTQIATGNVDAQKIYTMMKKQVAK